MFTIQVDVQTSQVTSKKLIRELIIYANSTMIESLRFLEPIEKSKRVRVHIFKATKFCEISTVDLFYVVPVKFMLEILQNFVAFSECINFIITFVVFFAG